MKGSVINASTDLGRMYRDFGITSDKVLAAYPTSEALLFKKDIFGTDIVPRVLERDWRKARKECIPNDDTVLALLIDPRYLYYLMMITVAMDGHRAWYKMLENRGVLKGAEMEKFVAKLDTLWKKRLGQPTYASLGVLIDEKFIETPLTDFFAELSKTSSSIAAVIDSVTKDMSELKAKDPFEDRTKMRAWLLECDICPSDHATELMDTLRDNGINSVDDLEGYKRKDLEAVGFKGRQLVNAVRALK